MMITDTNSTGLPYYHRAETNETVWEKPDEYAKATLAGWERFFDAATSCAYWSNALTGEVRWTEPERYANYDGNSSTTRTTIRATTTTTMLPRNALVNNII